MLNKIRNFSKTISAKILLVIVVIPFVFWGMGGVFNSGNTNSIAKINKINISTQEFIEYLNNSKIDQNFISANINNNILEELLRQFISVKILQLEIKSLKILVTDKDLAITIKKNKDFLDEENNFSRVKYEKFLLTNNLNASIYENSIRERILQEKLFSYIGAGVKSPKFLTNNKYINDNKKVDVKFINLENIYKSKKNFTKEDIENYIEKNTSSLETDFIDFSYSKITPLSLTGADDFNNDFFDKVDDIENKISNNLSFNEIVKFYNLKTISKNEFSKNNTSNKIENKIYDMRLKSKLSLIDENDFFLLYSINNIKKKLPDKSSSTFIETIKDKLYNDTKYEFNQDLIKEINENTFNDTKFENLVNGDLGKINNVTIKSINDYENFDQDSVNIIYSMPVRSFVLVSDEKNNIFIVKILREETSIITDKNELNAYNEKSASDLKRDILFSYDQILNSKYEIKINEKTLDRVKNYF